MGTNDYDSITNALSTGVIVAIAVGSVFGVFLLIAFIVILVCIIKRCNRSSYAGSRGMVLQQPYSYPQSLTSQYPPNLSSVANYPPAYPSAPPPYSAVAPTNTKPPYS